MSSKPMKKISKIHPKDEPLLPQVQTLPKPLIIPISNTQIPKQKAPLTPDEIKGKLLEYQHPHIESLIHSLKTYNRALDASDTGTGKTYSAIATCLLLGLKPLIICPKSVLTSWITVINYFQAEFYGISNYELFQNCKFFTHDSLNHKAPCGYLSRFRYKSKDKSGATKDNYTFRWQKLPTDMIIIFDEAHRCKNSRTVNHVLLHTAAQTNNKILMLSATIADKPENFALAGYVLGLYPHKRHALNWMSNAGKGYSNIMTGVQKRIYPEYAARMRIKNLGKLFPNNQVVAQCYDMDCADEIQKQYKLIEEEVKKLQKKEDNSQNVLARIMYARMKIEQLKIPTFLELIKTYLAEGNSVAVFVNFTATLKTIADELKTGCLIFGEQSLEERTNNIDDFNEDRSQIIICNIRSGGVGISLHDKKGKYPRVSVISPSWSAQDIIQALGRVHRADGKTPVRQRIVFCKKTIEEDICERMKDKIVNIACLNDANTGSYKIDGLMDDTIGIGVDKDGDLSEVEKILQKITVLNIKRKRLIDDLLEVDQEIYKLRESLKLL